MNIVDILAKGRIVELNPVLVPGQEDRRLELRQFRIYAGEFMYDIDMMSHLGAHVESPAHYLPALKESIPGKDISEYPPEKFWGEAVFVDLSKLPPAGKITPDFIKSFGVKRDDIVLMGNSPHMKEGEKVTMTDAGAVHMAELGIKMLAMDMTFQLEEVLDPLEAMRMHYELLTRDILVIERLTNLSALKTPRSFFIGLPVRIKGCDSFPIRAIAIEGIL
jgi:kynurenine formamidase